MQVGTNGIITFGEPLYLNYPELFPGIRSEIANAFILAPFWDNVDIRKTGNISYEVHSRITNNEGSLELLQQSVSSYATEMKMMIALRAVG